MNQPVPLTPLEIHLCRWLAKKRGEENRARGVTSVKQCGESDEAIDLQGIGGEMAFCKLFGLWPDLNYEIRSKARGEDLGDCWCEPLGWVDVKTTRAGKGYLNIRRPSRVGYYALMEGDFPEFCFRGLIPAADAIRPEYIKDVGNGPYWAVPASALKPYKPLWVPK